MGGPCPCGVCASQLAAAVRTGRHPCQRQAERSIPQRAQPGSPDRPRTARSDYARPHTRCAPWRSPAPTDRLGGPPGDTREDTPDAKCGSSSGLRVSSCRWLSLAVSGVSVAMSPGTHERVTSLDQSRTHQERCRLRALLGNRDAPPNSERPRTPMRGRSQRRDPGFESKGRCAMTVNPTPPARPDASPARVKAVALDLGVKVAAYAIFHALKRLAEALFL